MVEGRAIVSGTHYRSNYKVQKLDIKREIETEAVGRLEQIYQQSHTLVYMFI